MNHWAKYWGCCAAIVGSFGVGAARAEEPARLWIVDAVKIGAVTVCDAYARGAAGRAPYEFRFRRDKTSLFLIVSYEGEALAQKSGDATIIVDKEQFVLPATTQRFNQRNAFIISVNPKSVDFNEFNATIPFEVRYGGATFKLAFSASDALGQRYAACLKAAKIQ